MNQQAIDRVKERLSKYLKRTDDSDKSYDNGYCKALEHTLEDLQALGDGWIQTSIRLPEPHKNVLLWEGGYEPLELNEPIIGWYDTRYGFRTKGDGPIATHWMPLPLPPKQ